jgi:hypothetical protein
MQPLDVIGGLAGNTALELLNSRATLFVLSGFTL